MHVLFVTRKFPPSTGGMETLAADTYQALLDSGCRVTLVKKGGHDLHHWWWVPWALGRMRHVIRFDRPDVVLLGDALMNVMATPVLRIAKLPHATMVMGLDVTFDSSVYRKVVVRHLRWAPLIIAISNATASAVRAAGVEEDHLHVLRLSVARPEDTAPRESARAALRRSHDIPDDAVVLLTLGRLVRRKGVAWFVSQVLPHLDRPFVYLVAGSGPAQDRIERISRSKGLTDRVRLLGRVDDVERELLLRGADLFVQPNIHVYGDMEGFGLVNVEAAVRDLPVLAANIEGIPDAVFDGRTGYLLPSQDAAVWRTRLRHLTDDLAALERTGAEFGATARQLYSPQRFATELHDLLAGVARRGRTVSDIRELRADPEW